MRISLNIPENCDEQLKIFLREFQRQVNICFDVADKKIENVKKEINKDG